MRNKKCLFLNLFSHFDERAYNFLGLIKHMLTDPKLHILCKTHEGPDISALDKIMPMFRDCPAETFSVLYSANNLPSPFRHDHTAGLIQMFARFPEMLERKVHLFALKTHNRYAYPLCIRDEVDIFPKISEIGTCTSSKKFHYPKIGFRYSDPKIIGNFDILKS